jgi:hypothetical protein
MSRTGRNSLLVLVIGVLVAGLSMMALAAEEGDEGAADDGTTTTIADTGLIPAVQMDDGGEAPAQADWTYRYLIPTGLALAAIIVLVTAVKYFTDVVRRRYRIIEE